MNPRCGASAASDAAAAAVRHAQRASGQAVALPGMIAAGRPFAEISQQLLAARGSLDSLLVRLIDLELDECLPVTDSRQQVDELLRTAFGRNAPVRATRRRRRKQPSHPTIGGTIQP